MAIVIAAALIPENFCVELRTYWITLENEVKHNKPVHLSTKTRCRHLFKSWGGRHVLDHFGTTDCGQRVKNQASAYLFTRDFMCLLNRKNRISSFWIHPGQGMGSFGSLIMVRG